MRVLRKGGNPSTLRGAYVLPFKDLAEQIQCSGYGAVSHGLSISREVIRHAVCFLLCSDGNVDRAQRLLNRPASRSGNPRDAHSDVRVEPMKASLGHGTGGLGTDGSVVLDGRTRNAKPLDLHFILIGDYTSDEER